MEKWTYDLEVFKNFFSAAFVNVDTKEERVFILYKYRNDLKDLVDFVNREIYLIGYNNTKYDDLILNYLILNYKDNSESNYVTELIYNLSKSIIESQRGGGSIYNNKSLKNLLYSDKYLSLDLMAIMAFDKLKVGLKQVSVNMKWHKIQDLPKHFDSEVENNEVDTIIKYNFNDVYITLSLFEIMLPEIQLRQSVANQYKIRCMNASRSKIADLLMNKFYSEKSGLNPYEFRDLRDDNTTVHFKDIIWSKLSFNTNVLQDTLTTLMNTVVTAEKGNKDFKLKIPLFECMHEVAKGGLHSKMPSKIYEECDEYKLIDLDFGSFYPCIMLMLDVHPPQLGKAFLEVLKMVTEQRLAAKKAGDKVTADALKIVINSIYGKLGFEHGYMYSPASMYSVTINGQLILLKLIETLELAGMRCFYSNTDGATFKVPRNLESEFYRICDEYEKWVDIPLEFVDYKKCIIRDVNNYLIITSEGKIKQKGAFVTDVALDKGFDKPVIAKAVYEHFVNGTNTEEFIRNHEDIYDFCKSQKVGGQFTVEMHSLDNNQLLIEKLQKTNRFFVSSSGNKIYKRKTDDSLHDTCSGYTVTLFNDYYESSNYGINYQYYIREANKLIESFYDNQYSLF